MNNGYLGYDNKARKIHTIYVGSNNKAHTCIKGYVGDSNNKARLAFDFKVNVPTLVGTYVYNTQEQSVVISGLNPRFITVSGTTKATNAGTYTVTFSLNHPSITWSDGSRTDKTATWTIAKAPITMVVSKLEVQKSGTFIEPETYTDYEYVVRAKLTNTEIMYDLPISVSGQFDVISELTGNRYWWNYGGYYAEDYSSSIDYVSQNRFSCHAYFTDIIVGGDGYSPGGNAQVTVSIPETANLQAASGVTYSGSTTNIYHEELGERSVNAANLTIS